MFSKINENKNKNAKMGFNFDVQRNVKGNEKEVELRLCDSTAKKLKYL